LNVAQKRGDWPVGNDQAINSTKKSFISTKQVLIKHLIIYSDLDNKPIWDSQF